MMIRRLNNGYALAIVPFCVFIALVSYPFKTPFITTDSPGYMYFGDDRPVGYPAFLWLLHGVTGGYDAVPFAQAFLLCAALGAIAFAYHAYSGGLWKSLLLEVLLFSNLGLLLLSRYIMSDGLSAVCIALYAAALITLLHRRSITAFVALILIAAVAITLRPVHSCLIVPTVITIMLFGTRLKISRAALLCFLTVAVICAQLLTPVVHHLRGDSRIMGTPLARGLLQKTLFRQWPGDAASEQCEGKFIAAKTLQTDRYLRQMPDRLRPYMLSRFSGYLRFMVIIPGLVKKYGYESASETDPVILCYAMHIMRSHPRYFIEDAAEQLWGMLTYSTYISPKRHAQIVAYLKAHPPVLPSPEIRHDTDFKWRAQALKDTSHDELIFSAQDVNFDPPVARSQLLANGLRIFQVAAALVMEIGVLLLFAKLFRYDSDPALLAIGIMGTAFFSEMIVTAIVELAQPRYVYALWPFLCLCLALAVKTAREMLARRRILTAQRVTGGTQARLTA